MSGAVSRLYDLLSGYESRRAPSAYPIHKRLSFDAASIDDVYDWIVHSSAIRPDAAILDAGCGVGFGAQKLASAAPGAEVLGISISESEIELARRYLGSGLPVRFELGSFDRAEVNRFDLIVAVESLKHSLDLDASLSRLGAALRPGGMLVIVDDYYDGRATDRAARILVETWHLTELHREEDVTSRLGAADCEIVDLTGHVRLRSHWRNRLRNAGLRVAASFPGTLGRVATVFHGGVALDRLYAAGSMRYLAIRYRKPAGAVS